MTRSRQISYGVLPIGTDGQTLVANSANASGLGWNQNFAAGKNKIINGDFGIWQRGTSFTPAANAYTYLADRFRHYRDGSGSTVTVSQQTFISGTAPVSGYEGTYYLRYAQSVAGTGSTYSEVAQAIEDVRVYAGQTVTFSFWAKADTTRVVTPSLIQVFGSGGSSAVTTNGAAQTLTTSWARYTASISVPSVSGKTIGSGSFLSLSIVLPLNTTQTIDIWGVQLEAGSVATAFQTATGTLQGELAACQRYGYTPTGGIGIIGSYYSTTSCYTYINLPVSMRTTPTLTVVSQTGATVFSAGTSRAATAIASDTPTVSGVGLAITTSAATAGNVASVVINNGALFWSAEL